MWEITANFHKNYFLLCNIISVSYHSRQWSQANKVIPRKLNHDTILSTSLYIPVNSADPARWLHAAGYACTRQDLINNLQVLVSNGFEINLIYVIPSTCFRESKYNSTYALFAQLYIKYLLKQEYFQSFQNS